jgi:pyruvate formate lyase activating enzyme
MSVEISKPIYSITPFTLLDYPNYTACILWFAGCNMKCQYCYNPEIVNGDGKISFDEALTFLKKRVNLLDGVVISGGEATRNKELISFVEKIKELGFLIKLDTNGSAPNVLKRLIEKRHIDYVALDLKATPEKFYSITESKLERKFWESLQLIQEAKLLHEVRTTFHRDLLCVDDLRDMSQKLDEFGYQNTFYVQNFRGEKETIGQLNRSISFKSDEVVDFPIPVEIR